MQLNSFEIFILGVLVSVPITVIGGLYATRLEKRLAKRSEKRAQARIVIIKREYEEARKYHDDPIQIVFFVGVWILWLTIYWILQSLLDALFSFGANGSYFANQNGVASLINTVDSLVSVIFLTYIFRSGYRSYRIVRRIRDFDSYQSSYFQELATLEQVEGVTPSPVAAVDPVAEPLDNG
jgi:H+/gluconate symporter-like permease